MNDDNYLKLKLYQYFLLAYQSKNTKVRKNGLDVVELFETTGYHPWVYYEANKYKKYQLPERLMLGEDLLNILKSILIQSCDIDSLEIAFSKYNNTLLKTIVTSKFNYYETFHNYLLMDWQIQTIPKRIYNYQTPKFEDYCQNEFFISDNELRLKSEIQSIKKLVSLKEQSHYFR